MITSSLEFTDNFTFYFAKIMKIKRFFLALSLILTTVTAVYIPPKTDSLLQEIDTIDTGTGGRSRIPFNRLFRVESFALTKVCQRKQK